MCIYTLISFGVCIICCQIGLSIIATLSTIYMLVGLYRFDCTAREDPVAELQEHWDDQ